MKIYWGQDGKGQLYLEWEQVAGIYKRAWIQRKADSDKDWAKCGRYLNVVRVEEPGKGPKGNATDFPIFNDLPDRQILSAFVSTICAMTGIELNDDSAAENEACPIVAP